MMDLPALSEADWTRNDRVFYSTKGFVFHKELPRKYVYICYVTNNRKEN